MDKNSITKLFTDGGMIPDGGPINSRSAIGGTWAWCAVSAGHELIASASGVVLPVPGQYDTVTNNIAEFVAACEALEYVPEGWCGTFYSDSRITIGRLFYGNALNGLGRALVLRGSAAIRRIGKVEPVLLSGHPSKADLARGFSARHATILPVSKWNVMCDQLCSEEAKKWKQTNGM